MSPAKHWLAWLLRLTLGGVFFYAGLIKIWQPFQYAAAIEAYQLLPQFLLALAAAVIPWIEVVCASSLVLYFKPRSALLTLISLLGIFLIIMLFTMARGLDIDCGCGLLANRRVGWLVLLEDSMLLLAAAWLYRVLSPE
ncbi:MauE/DoxX family redox-associated membrane protein [Desulfobacca acetoxidans]|uniref:Methylamine utilization protein MauE n=1 Tax=Desulfobacca acetoxidans (strain ATCC 700848 / DSM 11109 / ASRB2) TaxID=880072 RepID=F2NFD6_DESAR|nr:MauE/DoxX family redox-associated membrane protein [Desulfobacca acetoxidans]AEB10055.1 methylamine utilization protein MauE [Desulfobacca acetoxidans DSM 11109]HAY21695.1 DoxX family protein [Desulfobacterales bacterium]